MFDYIVVGAGSAGCVIAARLSEDPSVSVLLVEAGGQDTHPYIHMPAGFAKLLEKNIASWGWSTVPQKHVSNTVYAYPQGKVLGGSSSINAMVYTRGNSWDYDNWAKTHGCKGWSFKDVLPYFRRAEDNQRLVDKYHSAGGPLGVSDPISPLPISSAFIRAAQEAGMPYNPDFNGADQFGVGFYQTTTRNARRCSAAVAYLRPAISRKNLTVWTRTITHRIVFKNRRAVGIEISRSNSRSKEIINCGSEVVITAGALNSPKLLMLSGVGNADELTKLDIKSVQNLPGVGQNLHDHFDLLLVAELQGDYSYDKHTRLHKTLAAGLQYILLKNGPVTSNLAEAGGFWKTDRNSRAADVQYHFMLGSGVESLGRKLQNCGVTLNCAHMLPRSRGTISLASSDTTAMPLIDPNFWAEEYDRKQLVAGFKKSRDIIQQDAFRKLIKGEVLPGPDIKTNNDIVGNAGRFSKTDYHPVGACKMGNDDLAVVSPKSLFVHGLQGLRVCDSSIMPQVVASNTNAATIMIAEKAADLIRLKPQSQLREPAN